MPRKLSLPVAQRFADALHAPSIDAMRARLGGRATGQPASFPIGAFVRVPTSTGASKVGVLLSGDRDEAFVYLERGLVKRTESTRVERHLGEVPGSLLEVAERAHVFASLREGQLVTAEERGGRTRRGVLKEKCRYGGLVETDEGTVLGVGFGKLSPS